MSNYSYVAVDSQGSISRGTLAVTDQSEALRRIREMGLFPTRVLRERERRARSRKPPAQARARSHAASILLRPRGSRVNPATLAVFTRQLATLVEAGMPLLRGLRLLEEQEQNRALKRILGELGLAIESGNSFAEAVAMHPKVFNRLYANMIKAGEISGALDLTLRRLADFLEKSRRLKGKVKSALIYPCAVLFVAMGIITLLMVWLVPRFEAVFRDLGNGKPLPAFTRMVLGLSAAVTHHLPAALVVAAVFGVLLVMCRKTQSGHRWLDRIKISAPLLGPVFRKLAISRFARTLGTLLGSGVPILQALTIVKDTAGNVVVGDVISTVHDRVKEGDPVAPALRASGVFPVMVAGMVDVGEQTGALPDMLLKIADNYEEEVDNAVGAMTSMLEPIMIVFLAVVVGSIVIAMFLPIIRIFPEPGDTSM